MNKQSRYMLRQNLSYYKNRIKYGITKLHSTVSDNYIVFESYGGKKMPLTACVPYMTSCKME